MTNKLCKISLFSAILASVTTLPVDARVTTHNSNRSYAEAYNQVNALRYQQEYLDATATTATTASATATLPVMVSDEKLASAILNNTSETTVGDLDACAMIYPNGVFRWQTPESGIRLNQYDQCVAVVSLIDANTNTVLATTTVAAGDSFKCNIDNFPESGMNAVALSNTLLPADKAPSMEDVEAVMNEEQKQNAGLKIAAGAIIAGIAGNMLAPKEAGNSKMFGTSSQQLIGTAAGVATGAGVMAASSYGGKVAGDTIKSTAVNAASGMIVGNMLAGSQKGDSYIDIKKCNITDAKNGYSGERDCVAGKIEEKGTEQFTSDTTTKYLINASGDIKKCEYDGEYKCDRYPGGFVDIQLKLKSGGSKAYKSIFGPSLQTSEFDSLTRYYRPDGSDYIFELYDGDQKENTYYEIESAYEAKNAKSAYIVFKSSVSSLKGYKKSEFSNLIAGKEFEYFNRNSNGTVGSMLIATKEDKEAGKYVFTPLSKDADDGGLIDMSNKARAKGTAIGAAAGGAMGGFAGYQGAQSEITDRWTSAIREYNDSLSNFVCMTGTRYLSKYNDYVEIPEPRKSE